MINNLLKRMEAIYIVARMVFSTRYSIQYSITKTQDRLFPYRVYSKLVWRNHSQSTIGVAEADSILIGLMLSFCESYERFCVDNFQLLFQNKTLFGTGVGITSNHARRRAWGEYYERELISSTKFNFTEKSILRQFGIEVGKVHVCLIRDSKGSGYGLTQKEAIQSARRSELRKQIFISDMSQLESLKGSQPKEVEITFPGHWLKCYIVF